MVEFMFVRQRMKLKSGLIAFGVFASCTLSFAAAVQPVAMSGKSIGGGDLNAYTKGVENGRGLNNIGLLIKTWGKVTYKDPAGKFFYINDGSALKDGTKNGTTDIIGVRVSVENLATGNVINMDNVIVGNTYTITGVISTFADSEKKIRPMLRPRNQADVIQVI